jgi:hypothetical protein
MGIAFLTFGLHKPSLLALVQSRVKTIKINRLKEYRQNEVIGFKIKTMKASLAIRITLN